MRRYLLLILFFLGCSNVFAKEPLEFDSFIIKVKSAETIEKIRTSFPNIYIPEKSVFHNVLDIYSKNSNILLAPSANQALKNLQNYYIIYLPKKSNISGILFELKTMPEILQFERNTNYRIEEITTPPNDPLYYDQWGLKAVFAEKAWLKATGKGIIVGVVDTGIEWDHPDLVNQLWINSKEDINHNGTFEPWPDSVKINGISGDLNGIDDDGNGYADDVIGYSFVNQFVPNIGRANEFSPVPEDEHSHGTIVSGVIAAQGNNNTGIIGLAYNAKIMTLRAFDATGNAESDNIATAIVYGAVNGAKVLNFSFGEEQPSTIVHDAIKFAYSLGCVMSASSGNNGWFENHFPSDFEEVISVGSSNEKNQRDYQSNYGPRLGLVAPGTSILTTNFVKSYKKSSGTSLSAPFVSATMALLFEINPNLSPKDIYGILEATATDIESPGWDEKTGAGVLNAGSAVNFAGISNITISYPNTGEVFDRSKISKKIPIVASIVTPLFSSMQVSIGKGETPQKWEKISEVSSNQIKNDTIAYLNPDSLIDTVYTIRVLVNLKNYSTIEKRTYINIVSDASPLSILSVKAVDTWFGEKRAVAIACMTNQLTRFSVKYRPNNSTDEFTEVSDNNYETHFHTIVLSGEIPKNVLMEAQAICIRNDGKTEIRPFSFMRKNEEMTTSNFSKKYNTLPLLYVNNMVADLYGNGKKCFAADDISYGIWQSTKVFEFANNEFVQRDTLKDVWIPVGFGDSNGDGIQEILTKSFGASILFQSKTAGDSPFSSILFQDTISGNLRAAGLFDFTGDKKDEVVCFSDTAFHIISNSGSKYSILTQTSLPFDSVNSVDYKLIGTAPGHAFGDFDGDGKNELAFVNEKGQLFIFEFVNNTLKLEFMDINKTSFSPQIMCKADIDGDGIPELAILNYGSNVFFDREESGDIIWNFRILKSNGPNNYNYIAYDHFYGVRSGSTRTGVTYRNGLTSGNVDGIQGDEIIVSPFPYLYIFKWDNIKQQLKPFWWYSNAFANSAVVYDFDNNGTSEIGFSTGNGTQFFEYNAGFSGPQTPTGFDGYALNDSSAFLFWDKVAGSEGVNLYELILQNGNYFVNRILRTTKDSIELTGLNKNRTYQFLLQAYNKNLKDTVSDYSLLLDVYTHNPIKPTDAVPEGNRFLKIKFNGKLPWRPLEARNFKIVLNTNTEFLCSTVNRMNDSIAVLIFSEPLPKGNYSVSVNSFKDFYRTPTLATNVNFDIPTDEENPKEMYLLKLDVINNYKLLLGYSEKVDKSTAESISNYILKPTGKISKITLDENNPNQVFIELDKSETIGALGFTYTLTSSNIMSLDNIPITKGAGNTLGFVFFADNPDNAFVYPNPIELNKSPNIFFANLPTKASVYILSLSGELLQTLIESDGNGGVEWDGKDNKGNFLGSGVYLFKVKTNNSDGTVIESDFKKFAIVK